MLSCRYIFVSSAVVLLYTSFYQKVDAEELGGLWEVMKEGFISAYALFLVSSTFVHRSR